MPIGSGRSEHAGQVADPTLLDEGFYRFLRYGHILSSLLREFLESSFLGQLCPHRMTRSQFCFLKLIAGNSELQVCELARCLGVSPAASSKNLDYLEGLGLVVRETSREDRRATLLSASNEGRRLVDDFERLKASRLAPVIEQLGEERTAEFCDLLQEVCMGLLESGTVPEAPCLRCAGYYHPDCSVVQLHGDCALKPKRGVEA